MEGVRDAFSPRLVGSSEQEPWKLLRCPDWFAVSPKRSAGWEAAGRLETVSKWCFNLIGKCIKGQDVIYGRRFDEKRDWSGWSSALPWTACHVYIEAGAANLICNNRESPASEAGRVGGGRLGVGEERRGEEPPRVRLLLPSFGWFSYQFVLTRLQIWLRVCCVCVCVSNLESEARKTRPLCN